MELREKEAIVNVVFLNLNANKRWYYASSFLIQTMSLCRFMSKYSKEDPNHKRLVLVDQALSVVFQSLNRVPESCLEPGRKLMASHRPTRSNLKAMLLQILWNPSCLVSGVLTEGGIYIGMCGALWDVCEVGLGDMGTWRSV